MKILFVSPVGAMFSGAEIAIVNLMKFLAKNGHEIYNVIPDNLSNRDENYLKEMQDNNIHLYQLTTLKWWWQESSDLFETNIEAVKLYQHKNISEVRKIIQENQIELVISNTVNVFQGALAAACEQIPHFYIIHEFPYGEFGYYKEKIALINQLSDKIFAVEGELYQSLLTLFPAEKLIAFTPFSNARVTNLKESESNRIISIGGITERKNQLELIKAYHLMGRFEYELIFIGGGDDNYIEKCQDYIKLHQLHNISFLGYQPDPWELVTDKDIIVFPSKLEAFPLVFVESILNGIPAIVSDNVGHKSVSQYFNTDTFYSLGEVDELADLLLETLQNFANLKKGAEALKLEAQKLYTLENTADVFLREIGNTTDISDKKVIHPLQSLLGLNVEKDFLESIRGNEIRAYFPDSAGQYTPFKSVSFPVSSADDIELNVRNIKSIRIDLTENPNVFQNVSLKTNDGRKEFEPIINKGYKKDNKIIFYEQDHSLEYQFEDSSIDRVIFSYTRDFNDFYGELLNNELSLKKNELQDLQSKYDTLVSSYADLSNQYNGVVNSRRWTIPTKIINFIRRRK